MVLGFEGSLCDREIPEATPITAVPVWYWSVVGVGVVLLAMLLLLLTVSPYIMWKKRSLLIMRLVHYFHRYEDDGNV